MLGPVVWVWRSRAPFSQEAAKSPEETMEVQQFGPCRLEGQGVWAWVKAARGANVGAVGSKDLALLGLEARARNRADGRYRLAPAGWTDLHYLPRGLGLSAS